MNPGETNMPMKKNNGTKKMLLALLVLVLLGATAAGAYLLGRDSSSNEDNGTDGEESSELIDSISEDDVEDFEAFLSTKGLSESDIDEMSDEELDEILLEYISYLTQRAEDEGYTYSSGVEGDIQAALESPIDGSSEATVGNSTWMIQDVTDLGSDFDSLGQYDATKCAAKPGHRVIMIEMTGTITAGDSRVLFAPISVYDADGNEYQEESLPFWCEIPNKSVTPNSSTAVDEEVSYTLLFEVPATDNELYVLVNDTDFFGENMDTYGMISLESFL
jgi:hypothetical protein